MFEPRHIRVDDRHSGLLGFIVIDDTTLGPAAGGIRTRAYADEAAASAEAAGLARAMTLKCSLAGLPAGGGKGVVMLRDGLRRDAAFAALGRCVDELGGDFLTAGDLGTTPADLQAMARHTAYVHTDAVGLAAAVGAGCVHAIRAGLAFRGAGGGDLSGVRVAVQGVGTVGAAVARGVAARGAQVTVADTDGPRAEAVAAEIGAVIADPSDILGLRTDVLAPCAVGGVLDHDTATAVRAGIVCGGANNILASPAVEERLMERGVIFVPDVVSSAGAVILGVGRMVEGVDDYGALLEGVFDTTTEVLATARDAQRRAADVARDIAISRIVAARGR